MVKEALPAFEEIEHMADLALRVYGKDPKELFVHAAQGMFSLMQCAPQEGAEPFSCAVELTGYDLEGLLVDWLNELLYLSEREGVCFEDFEIEELTESRLSARARGKRPCVLGKGIKAATFFDLQVVQRPDGYYEATVTFDV